MQDLTPFERAVAAGGVVVFPSDTVYGLACDPESASAVERLYALKRRPPDKPAAVMFFSLGPALAALPELGPRTRAALAALLPGAVTLLLPNPRGRFPLACASDTATLGLRVAGRARAAARAGARPPDVGQPRRRRGRAPPRATSRSRSEPAPTSCSTAASCPARRRRWSTCARYEETGEWAVLRAGMVASEAIASVLDPPCNVVEGSAWQAKPSSGGPSA